RFFDESGGMQMGLHAPFGGRINRAWGLALRKRFCRGFGFELQAAANEEAIVISLGTHHSFPLEDVFNYLHPKSVQSVLTQAILDQPMFESRWRWNATRALVLERFQNGRAVAPQILRMRAGHPLFRAVHLPRRCAAGRASHASGARSPDTGRTVDGQHRRVGYGSGAARSGGGVAAARDP